MKRNLSHRVEVAAPVYDPEVRRQLERVLALQLGDNRKARVLDAAGANPYARDDGPPLRAQEAFRSFVAEL
jgi:polyphosphate kinase